MPTAQVTQANKTQPSSNESLKKPSAVSLTQSSLSTSSFNSQMSSTNSSTSKKTSKLSDFLFIYF
jgi:hypothetical protein